MTGTHAERRHGERKTHGDAMESAMADARKMKTGTGQRSIPQADNGNHARSQAAHLGGYGQESMKAASSVRQPGQERQPPQEVSRAGKDYRRQ